MVQIIDDTIKPYYDENLGAVISSKTQRKKLMKKRGVTFASDYSKFKPNRKPMEISRDDLQKAKMMVKYKKIGQEG
jgi:hypothetical protein